MSKFDEIYKKVISENTDLEGQDFGGSAETADLGSNEPLDKGPESLEGSTGEEGVEAEISEELKEEIVNYVASTEGLTIDQFEEFLADKDVDSEKALELIFKSLYDLNLKEKEEGEGGVGEELEGVEGEGSEITPEGEQSTEVAPKI